jgi:hypothetical protein
MEYPDILFYGPMIFLACTACASVWYLFRISRFSVWIPTFWGHLCFLMSIPLTAVIYKIRIDQDSGGALWYAYSVVAWPLITCLIAIVAFVVGDVLSWVVISLLKFRR